MGGVGGEEGAMGGPVGGGVGEGEVGGRGVLMIKYVETSVVNIVVYFLSS
jgi:hypothetical protein